MLTGMHAQILRPSAWTFVTSSGAGLTIGFFSAEGGSLTLAEPGTQGEVKLRYAALGAAAGFGFKLPKVGKLLVPGASGSLESFPSTGTVFMAPQFKGTDLSRQDFDGACSLVEVSGAVTWGASGSFMLFGMNVAAFLATTLMPASLPHALATAKGYLFFGGMNYGVQAGISIGSLAGILKS